MRQRILGVGEVALDIGANIGTTALTRVIAGDTRVVYAAEPEPLNYRCLVENIRANGLQGFILPDAVALSNESGQAFFRRESRMSNHHLVADGRVDVNTVRVTTLTLDAWVARCEIDPASVAFVKMDVQGWKGTCCRGDPAFSPVPTWRGRSKSARSICERLAPRYGSCLRWSNGTSRTPSTSGAGRGRCILRD